MAWNFGLEVECGPESVARAVAAHFDGVPLLLPDGLTLRCQSEPWQDVEGNWWKESGVHQNITFSVHPDPISGMQCWHQAVKVTKGGSDDHFGDIMVDRAKARAVHEEWRKMTRPPKGDLRRPLWLPRAVRPADEAYHLVTGD